jgi:hypothetical protein
MIKRKLMEENRIEEKEKCKNGNEIIINPCGLHICSIQKTIAL